MDPYVVLATKGRPAIVLTALDWLAKQSQPPRAVFIVGTEDKDVLGYEQAVRDRPFAVHVVLSPRVGLCAQRNYGIEQLAMATGPQPERPYFVVFLDDDFRPHRDWLRECQRAMLADERVVGVSGMVLADGINNAGLSEDDAEAYVEGRLPPMKHWASGDEEREIECTYGCNMAFRDRVIELCRFDENLPLYGWQEDRDFSARARAFGQLRHVPGCKGVHMGVKSGRISGRRFGYSQIANAWYLWRKGTMPSRIGIRFASRHLLANGIKGLWTSPLVDYRGRLAGNLIAFVDLARGRCHPMRAVEL